MKKSITRVIYAVALWTIANQLVLTSGQCFSSSSGDASSGEAGTTTNSPVEEESSNFQAAFYDRQLEFSLEMFHKLYKKEDKSNLFFSPHSIHQALMLAYFGASGDTEKQLKTVLHLENDSKEENIKTYKMENYYRETRAANASQYDLRVANRIFFSEQEPVRACVQEIFSKEIELLDFVKQPDESRQQINSWVETNTNGKIKDLIPNGVVTSKTRLALANSAYFKGSWEHAFKKNNTKLSLFYVSPKEVTHTMMMYQKGAFRHGVSEALRSYIIELPYEGEAVSMFILLPPFTPDALQETLARLNSTTLRQAMDEMYEDSIEVSLPRFRIKQNFDLSKTLQTIGVVDLFDEKKANLSDFSDKPNLSIGTALHQSNLEVDELGSTASAATILIDTRSGRPLDQTRFLCNHPFVFFIYDNAMKHILFMGAFRSPKTEKH